MAVTTLRTIVSLLLGLLLLLRASFADDGAISEKLTADTMRGGEEDAALLNEILPLDVALTYAREHNPAIHAARERWRATQHSAVRASAYDDPTVMWDNWNAPENLRFDQADNNIFRFSQKIPFPGKLRLKGAIADKEAERMEVEIKSAELDTIAQVKKAYYDLWLIHQNRQVYSREKDLVAQFARIAEQKYAVGQASQPDVLRAQVEVTRLINRVTTETLALDKTRAQLNALLSRPPEAPLGVPQDPPSPVVSYSMTDLETLTLKNRPELAAQVKAVERENLVLALARKAYYPDFEVSVGRFVNFGQQDGFGLALSATLPLAFKYKYDAGVEEAIANRQATRSALRRVQDQALFEVKQGLIEAQTAREQYTLFLYTHIPQAEQTLAASQIGYQTGGIDFLSLIDSVRAIEQVHLEHFMAAANFEKAWAGLERAVGQELPRK